jgi:hypothetical protein
VLHQRDGVSDGSITIMGAEPNNIRELLAEIKAVRLDIGTRDHEILVGMRRPAGGEGYGGASNLERKSAIQMCLDRHAWRNQKNEGRWVEYVPGGAEVDEALNAMQAWRSILRHDDIQRLDDIERKALSSFSFGSAGWVTPPRVSTRILSCLTDPTDVLSMFDQHRFDPIPDRQRRASYPCATWRRARRLISSPGLTRFN